MCASVLAGALQHKLTTGGAAVSTLQAGEPLLAKETPSSEACSEMRVKAWNMGVRIWFPHYRVWFSSNKLLPGVLKIEVCIALCWVCGTLIINPHQRITP